MRDIPEQYSKVKKNTGISIIVPIYNVEQYLIQCIESILEQSLSNIEIILVDDGSKDNSGNICDEYARRDSRIRVIHKENGGLVSARKAGLELATGDYIAYVDGDDFIESNMYEVMYAKAVQENADIVIVGYLADNGQKLSQKKNVIASGVYKGDDMQELYSKMLYSGKFYVPGIIPAVWNKLFKKEVLYDCQMNVPNEIQMGEDVACTYRSIMNAKVVMIDNDFYPYHYRYVPNSMSKGIDENYFQNIFLLYRYLRQCLQGARTIESQIEFYLAYLVHIGINSIFGKRSKLNNFQKCVYVKKLEEEYSKKQRGLKIHLPWYISIEKALCAKKICGLLPFFLRISDGCMSLKRGKE